jgi:CHAD domain-containing protein
VAIDVNVISWAAGRGLDQRAATRTMAYQIDRCESTATELSRIAVEQIDAAIGALRAADEDPEKAVHEARKRFKEIRAVLRLARQPLGDRFAFENQFFRDLGRKLSAARDADAIAGAFDSLKDRLHPEAAAVVSNELEIRRRQVDRESIMHVEASLYEARMRPALWPLPDDGFDLIREGLKRTYRDGRKALRATTDDPDAHNFHQWRKRVKDHWYHAQLLEEMLPEGYVGRLKRLSRLLGDQHDLAVLGELLTADAQKFGGEDVVGTVMPEIETKRRQLEREARTAGVPIYAGRPKEWIASMESQWSRWRSSVPTPTPPAPGTGG